MLHCLVVLLFAGPFANQLRTATGNLLMSVRTPISMYHGDLQATDLSEILYLLY